MLFLKLSIQVFVLFFVLFFNNSLNDTCMLYVLDVVWVSFIMKSF